MATDPRFAFFLGGQDLEMVTIRDFLAAQVTAGDPRVAHIADKSLPWGAKASDYAEEIAQAVATGLVPVLIELAPDLPLPQQAKLIDHHGDRSHEACALRQVFDLLGLPEDRWTRHFALVAANDTGHIKAMQRIGATGAEITAIRRADRLAQGVTAQEEAEGLAALKAGEAHLDGSLLIVDLPHGRSATVADPMTIAGDLRDLLILSPTSTQFFGDGARIAVLDHAFPGGWRGGELPTRGFWGVSHAISKDDVVRALQGR